MKENMKRFLQLAGEEKELGNSLKALIQENQPDLIEKVISLAGSKGIVLVKEDFIPDQEISLEELNSVAGGTYIEEDDCWISAASLDYCGWWGSQH